MTTVVKAAWTWNVAALKKLPIGGLPPFVVRSIDPKVNFNTIEVVGMTQLDDVLVVSGQTSWIINKTTDQLTFTSMSTFQGNLGCSHAGVTSNFATVVLYDRQIEIGSLIMLGNPKPLFSTFSPKALPTPLHLRLSKDNGQCDLCWVGSLKCQVIFKKENYHFAIAASTFKHKKLCENLEYKATRPNGTALPGWLKFNPKIDGVSLPKDTSSEDVMVAVKDGLGDEVFIKLNKDYRHTQGDKSQEVSKTKHDFSKSLHAAGKMGWCKRAAYC